MHRLAMLAAGFALVAAAPAHAYDGENYAKDAAISMQRAELIALKARPGKISDRELEKEKGGSGLRYSFDIRAAGGLYEVGVDAKTGAVLENGKEGDHPD